MEWPCLESEYADSLYAALGSDDLAALAAGGDGTSPCTVSSFAAVLHQRVPTARRERENQLLLACARGHAMWVSILLDLGVDPCCTEAGDDADQSGSGWPALYFGLLHASRACLPPREAKLIVTNLLAAGADVNQVVEGKGYSAVYVAAQEGATGVLETLLAAGGSASLRCHKGYVALHVAAQYGHAESVSALLRASSDPLVLGGAAGASPIYLAAQNGHADAMVRLIAAGGNPHCAIEGGASPILSAAKNGHCEIVRILVDHGVNPDAPRDATTVAWRPSQIAAHGRDLEMIRTLMRTGSCLRSAPTDVPKSAADVLRDLHGIDVATLLGDELLGHSIAVQLCVAQLSSASTAQGDGARDDALPRGGLRRGRQVVVVSTGALGVVATDAAATDGFVQVLFDEPAAAQVPIAVPALNVRPLRAVAASAEERRAEGAASGASEERSAEGSAAPDWTWRDGRVVGYLPQTGEHQVALADRAGTVLWLRLHETRFRDWTALPRMRARDIALRGLVSLIGALPQGGEEERILGAHRAAREVVGGALWRFLLR